LPGGAGGPPPPGGPGGGPPPGGPPPGGPPPGGALGAGVLVGAGALPPPAEAPAFCSRRCLIACAAAFVRVALSRALTDSAEGARAAASAFLALACSLSRLRAFGALRLDTDL